MPYALALSICMMSHVSMTSHINNDTQLHDGFNQNGVGMYLFSSWMLVLNTAIQTRHGLCMDARVRPKQ